MPEYVRQANRRDQVSDLLRLDLTARRVLDIGEPRQTDDVSEDSRFTTLLPSPPDVYIRDVRNVRYTSALPISPGFTLNVARSEDEARGARHSNRFSGPAGASWRPFRNLATCMHSALGGVQWAAFLRLLLRDQPAISPEARWHSISLCIILSTEKRPTCADFTKVDTKWVIFDNGSGQIGYHRDIWFAELYDRTFHQRGLNKHAIQHLTLWTNA